MNDYRLRVINAGLIVSWLAALIFMIWGLSRTSDDRTGTLVISGAIVIALALLTLAPWRSVINTAVGDWLIVGWGFTALLAQLVVELRGMHNPSGVGFLLVPFFVSATAIAIPLLIVVELASISAYWIALGESSGYFSASTATSLLAFAAASVFVLLISIRVRTQFVETTTRYDALVEREAVLAEQEQELSNLYDVSLAIGAGSQMSQVLPELVGRVAAAVRARVGLVMQYDADTDSLSLMSPIWVSGHTIHTDELVVSLSEPSVAQRVFVSGDSTFVNDVPREAPSDRLLQELASLRVAAVLLRIEQQPIGVLLVGDTETPFTESDIATLESLAAPAALVLNQISRYEAARVSSERMTEVAQMKTDFVSVVSHELRTPLTSIIGALRTLQRPELRPPDDRANQLVDMAAKQANRLRTLIEDLLVMSRLEATSLPVRPVSIQLEAFLGDVLTPISGTGDVVLDLDPAAPNVSADPDHLARVITNLVENALKYGEDGDVEILTRRAGTEVRISVVDHGPGIPYEKHDVIFERFTQLAPNATRSKGGAGLGLSIVKGLAEAMNGRVWYEPTIGGGATFTVSLPMPEVDAEAEPSAT